jgi:hypothetical protein
MAVLEEALGSKSWVHGTRERGTRHTVAREQRKLSRNGLAATFSRVEAEAPIGYKLRAGQGRSGP